MSPPFFPSTQPQNPPFVILRSAYFFLKQPQHDEQALADAIQQALTTPIERTVLPRMRQSEVRDRVKKFIEDVDWWRKWQLTVGGAWGDLVGQETEEKA